MFFCVTAVIVYKAVNQSVATFLTNNELLEIKNKNQKRDYNFEDKNDKN